MADAPRLSSQRLTLRRPNRNDAEAIRRLADDWEVARRLARVPFPYTLDDALFFLDQIVPKEPTWIVQHASSGDVLGVAGLTPHADAGNMELGYWLGREFWGRGFATEAANVVLEHAFGAGLASEITAGCFADNIRSARVLAKLGFRIAGESLRLCLAEERELRHYDLLLTRESYLGWKPDF